MTVKRANEMLALVGHDDACDLGWTWADNETEFEELVAHWELHFDKEDRAGLSRDALIERAKMLDEFIGLI